MCWAAAQGSKDMSKGWAEELLQVQGLIWRASHGLGFGLKSFSRVWWCGKRGRLVEGDESSVQGEGKMGGFTLHPWCWQG